MLKPARENQHLWDAACVYMVLRSDVLWKHEPWTAEDVRRFRTKRAEVEKVFGFTDMGDGWVHVEEPLAAMLLADWGPEFSREYSTGGAGVIRLVRSPVPGITVLMLCEIGFNTDIVDMAQMLSWTEEHALSEYVKMELST